MPGITVSVVSFASRIGDVAANLERCALWAEKAADAGAQLVAFPELALSGYGYDPALRAVAEPIPGPTTAALVRIATEHDVYLSIGMMEEQAGNLHNAQILVGPEGYLGHYRKHYPTAAEREHLATLPGEAYPVFDICGLRLGINICADSRHLDTIDALARQGVDLVHNPHANFMSLGQNAEEWTRGKLVYYLERIMRCRAHFLINNLAGDAEDSRGTGYAFSGGAMILDPLGQVVTRTTDPTRTEAMITSHIDNDLGRLVPKFEMRALRDRAPWSIPQSGAARKASRRMSDPTFPSSEPSGGDEKQRGC